MLAYAKGESDRIKLLGGAEARAVEAVGRFISFGYSSVSQMVLLLTELKQSK